MRQIMIRKTAKGGILSEPDLRTSSGGVLPF
jgi:hypothetical protein